MIGNVYVYNEEMEAYLAKFFQNQTLKEANLTFTDKLFDEPNGGQTRLSFLLCTALGVLCNSFLVYMSYFNRHLKNDFRIVFGNLAIIDACFALSLFVYAFFHPFWVNGLGYANNIYLCTGIQASVNAFVMSVIPATVLTSFHRYIVIYKQNELYFTKRKLFLFCMASYYNIVWETLATILSRGYVQPVRVNNNCYMFRIPHVVLFNFLQLAILALAHLFFVIRLVQYLWINMGQLAVGLQKTAEEVQKEKRVVKGIVVQGLIPVLTITPNGCVALVKGLTGKSLAHYRLPVIGYTVSGLAGVLVCLNPVCDALTTFFIVRAYFDAFRETLAERFKTQSATVAPNPNHQAMSGNKHSVHHTFHK